MERTKEIIEKDAQLELETEPEELEARIAPGISKNHNETLVGE